MKTYLVRADVFFLVRVNTEAFVGEGVLFKAALDPIYIRSRGDACSAYIFLSSQPEGIHQC